MLEHMAKHIEIFICPSCSGNLRISGGEIRCLQCNHSYGTEGGIPLLFRSNHCGSPGKDVTDMVKTFYENNPFPNYEELENVSDLMQKARKSIFALLLNRQIPFNVKVLEVGCGTGQLCNFLGIAHRVVFGTDVCLNSLKLAEEFKKSNNLDRVGFYQMDLFRPIFKEESFPFVVCNGVLHHTSDPLGGFRAIARLVKKGGYIIIGLYNKYGRIGTELRNIIFRSLGGKFKFLDPHLRDNSVGEVRRQTWFADQYQNPHESKHTIGEVLGWFDEFGFDFVNGIPKPGSLAAFSEEDMLFEPNPRGQRLDHFIVQAGMMLTGGREGGLFLMIGRRRL